MGMFTAIPLAISLGFSGLFGIPGFQPAITQEFNTRVDTGVFTSVEYTEEHCLMEIETSDGNLWIVEDYIAPIGAECTVVFNTHGTSEVFDDSIKTIITVAEFE